jgi:hypothetical protein
MKRYKFSREHIYYTYVTLDPRKPGSFYYGHWKFSHEPFYVGKGKKNRYAVHLKYPKKKSRRADKIRKLHRLGLKPIVILICNDKGLTEKQAFTLEAILIKKIGRLDLDTGPLCNHTNGWEGISGYRHTRKTKAKISVASKGREITWTDKIVATRRKNGTYEMSIEQKAKLSKARKGRSPWNKGLKTGPQSPELIAKRFATLIGRKRTPEQCE